MKTFCRFFVLFTVLLSQSGLWAGHADRKENFWQQNVRKIHFDLHTSAKETELGKNFDPAHFAEQLKKSGTQAVVFFARGGNGFAYHPSKFNSPHPQLKTDLYGDVSRELHQRGLHVIAYFNIAPLCEADAKKHPDWVTVDAKGSSDDSRSNDFWEDSVVCPSSRYWEDSLIPQMAEIANNYPVDAFWMDSHYNFFSAPCYCERCRKLYGKDIPVGRNDPNWRSYYKHLQELVWDKMNLVSKAVHEMNPEYVLGSDWVGGGMWAYPAPDGFDFNTGDIRFNNGPLNAALALAVWSWRDKPVDINMQREYWWQEFNTRSIYDIQREFAVTLASCGTFMLGDVLRPFDMRIEDEKVRFYRDAFGGTAKMEKVVSGATPYADIAILVSPEQQRMLGKKWSVLSPDAARADPFYGTYTAVVEAGMTAHILFDADLKVNLTRYKTLVIPELKYIGSEAANAIEAYVKGGGGLVLVGGLPAVLDADENWSKARASDYSFFEKLAGIRVKGWFDYKKTFFSAEGTKLQAIWPEDVYRLPVGIWGTATQASLEEASMLAPIAAPGRIVQGGLPMGEILDNPAFSVNSYKKGKVYFAAQPLASQYWERGWRGLSCALQAIIEESAGDLYAMRHGGSMVQFFVTEKDHETAFHLVSYMSDMRTNAPRTLQKPVTISGPSIEVNTTRTIKSIHATNSSAPIDFKRKGNKITIIAPPFRIWESLVVHWN